MAKKLVDIEDLMVWTASELARKRPGKVVPLPVFNVSRSDGELMGRWAQPMGYPPMSPMFAAGMARAGVARGDPPHPDALIVEDVLSRMRLVDIEARVSVEDLTYGLGFALDGETPARAGRANAANMALVCGRMGKRPDLRLEPPDTQPRLAPNGKPGVWRRETWSEPTFDDHAHVHRDVEAPCPPTRKGVYPAGAYGVIEYVPAPPAIVDERADYAGWIAGLFWLAQALAGALETRAALTPRAALRPWMGERDGEPVRDLYRPGAEGVFGGDEARAMRAVRATGRRRPRAGGAVYVGGDGGDEWAEEA